MYFMKTYIRIDKKNVSHVAGRRATISQSFVYYLSLTYTL